ncbi:MAG: hypothetical protein K9N47_19520 [Prosthecobacter sp.]|uniref:hypothetical protein n=1 Tax=Prosthecobacter sp. TaxID=1965333 RepID=UPI0025F0E087|nr:hypothetical protein [Prosthecobacter sp.]MCF7788322.1 hypothetical protein [Prosthecobacter sp.]
MSARITNLKRIINCLSEHRHLCDDCLSSESGVAPRQTVNRLCRENSHLISECDDQPCEGQCRKEHKILRFLPRQSGGDTHEDELEVTVRASDEAGAIPKVDDILGDTEPSENSDLVQQRSANSDFSRKEYLHDNFNAIIARALDLKPADYLGRLSLDGLMDLKAITSNIHAVITLKLTFALVDWLQIHLNVKPEQARALNDAADATKPFVSGFDIDSSDPNLVAEVKGNIPVKGGSAFEAAQVKGLTDDVRQMFGLPPNGKFAERMSVRSKIHRPNLGSAMKFLGVFDSARVRAAVSKWMETFRKAHAGRKVELAEGVVSYDPDTVYVVFLTLGPAKKGED